MPEQPPISVSPDYRRFSRPKMQDCPDYPAWSGAQS